MDANSKMTVLELYDKDLKAAMIFKKWFNRSL